MMLTPQRERMRKTLKGEIPDKIPHGEVMIDDFLVERLTGTEMPFARKNSNIHWAFDRLSETEFQAHLKARELLGCDFLVVFPLQKLNEISKRDGYPVVRDLWGRVLILSPYTFETIYHPLTNIDDLRKYRFPKPEEFSWDNIELWLNDSPFFVACQIDVGFSMFAELIGYERLMFYIKDNKKEVVNFATRFYDFAKEMAQKAIEKGAECIWLADDFAHNNGTFIAPQDLYEIDFRFMKTLVDEVHKKGSLVNLHACGRVSTVIDILVELGIDSLHGLQPAAGNDIFLIKERYGKKNYSYW
ncbi:uroporphyrinogen decarboxylase family protein [Thermatribacter velox]|uniref:Uroporphyrinogen decarboxylase family protein n=1 Tax=Thermatribacter velox TaxID=3039681 RepID=A0ABZ2Y8T6_9BACT